MRLPAPSLRRRLPTLIGGLILAGVGTFAILAYQTVRASLMRAADGRLTSLANQIAPTMSNNIAMLRGAVERVASNPAIAAQLRAGSGHRVAQAAEVLDSLDRDSSAVLAVVLRDSAGTPVLTLAHGAQGTARFRNGALRNSPLDTSAVSRLSTRGDMILYEIRANVVRGGRLLGQVAQIRSAKTSNGEGVRTLSQLIGSDGAMMLGNDDGSVWTDLQGLVHRPPPNDSLVSYERDGVGKLAVSRPIRGSPLVLAFEFNADRVTAPLATMLRRFAAVALAIVLAGILLAWGVSRGITRPLSRLTVAAEAISGGDLQHPAPASARRDEIGRLSRAFAAMTVNVRNAHDTLEEQVADRTAELRLAQEENVRRERLATLGQLSSSVGHELRNPLGVMANAVYFLNATLREPNAKTREYLGILRTQIALSEKIVADLLDFARVKPPQRLTVPLQQIVNEQLGRVSIPEGVQVEQSGDLDTTVHVDPVQVGQVVLNLITNAAQAMEESGGRLGIEARRRNGTVRLSVRDTGPGILPENLPRVFEPLFTTKARGIGLGLSVSRTLAEANGGRLTAASAPDEGAVFTVELPADG